ncbi:MAG: PRC-barrel domain-containing protein [Candidatus Jacksonbacteria bacterium]
MLINSQKLIGLKAETESGQYLGRVQSLDVDIDAHGVRNYYIKPKLLEGGAFSSEFKVHQRQVVDITEEKMIVADTVVKYKEKLEKPVFIGTGAEVG